jgi:hypothetical protein
VQSVLAKVIEAMLIDCEADQAHAVE